MAGVQVISQAGAQVMLEGRPTDNKYIAGQVMFFIIIILLGGELVLWLALLAIVMALLAIVDPYWLSFDRFSFKETDGLRLSYSY